MFSGSSEPDMNLTGREALVFGIPGDRLRRLDVKSPGGGASANALPSPFSAGR